MATVQVTKPASGIVTISRVVLAVLAFGFVIGAMGQFFLAGLGIFESSTRWDDHAMMGHMLGLVTYILWIPAVLGRTGMKSIAGSLLLMVLFWAQYAFIQAGSTTAQALHPVNGSLLFLIAFWLGSRTVGQIWRESRDKNGAV